MNNLISIDKLLANDRRTLAKAITLVESSRVEDERIAQELLEKVLPHSGKSIRVGITGVPGVGKSTFIESFGTYLISKGHKVAVLAIDPSSPISGGAILGDKTRMEKLSQMDQAFIRPSPSSGFLGGVAQKTRESILLFEAAGYDFILVETVGVGQSEYEVADMVDFFIVLMLPNAGDELQGIKKGILELADLILVNKADGDYKNKAIQSMAQYQSAVDLMKHSPFWKTQVKICSALEGFNIETTYLTILDFIKLANDHQEFEKKRLSQSVGWYKKLTTELINLKLVNNTNLKNLNLELVTKVKEGKALPLIAAREYVESIFKK